MGITQFCILENELSLFDQPNLLAVFCVVNCEFAGAVIAISSRPASALHFHPWIDGHEGNDDVESPSLVESAGNFEVSPSASQIGGYHNFFTVYFIIDFFFSELQNLKSLISHILLLQSYLK